MTEILRSCSQTLGSLSKDVFERRMLTRSEAFSLFKGLDADKFLLLSFSSLIETIYPRVSTKPLSNDAKSPLPVDVRCSKTLLFNPLSTAHYACRNAELNLALVMGKTNRFVFKQSIITK